MSTSDKNQPKKPWSKPEMQTQELYERQALACGKNTPRQPQCFRRVTSS
jgi:hypothetical protein